MTAPVLLQAMREARAARDTPAEERQEAVETAELVQANQALRAIADLRRDQLDVARSRIAELEQQLSTAGADLTAQIAAAVARAEAAESDRDEKAEALDDEKSDRAESDRMLAAVRVMLSQTEDRLAELQKQAEQNIAAALHRAEVAELAAARVPLPQPAFQLPLPIPAPPPPRAWRVEVRGRDRNGAFESLTLTPEV